jgi:hypothetical protein
MQAGAVQVELLRREASEKEERAKAEAERAERLLNEAKINERRAQAARHRQEQAERNRKEAEALAERLRKQAEERKGEEERKRAEQNAERRRQQESQAELDSKNYTARTQDHRRGLGAVPITAGAEGPPITPPPMILDRQVRAAYLEKVSITCLDHLLPDERAANAERAGWNLADHVRTIEGGSATAFSFGHVRRARVTTLCGLFSRLTHAAAQIS